MSSIIIINQIEAVSLSRPVKCRLLDLEDVYNIPEFHFLLPVRLLRSFPPQNGLRELTYSLDI